MLYLHGGGWFKDDKGSQPGQLALLEGLRDKGVAIMSINYRKAPDYRYPSPIDDARCAVRFVRATATTNGFDSSKVAVFGFSAGGHLAALLGTIDDSPAADQQYGDHSSRVSSVVTLAGIFSFQDALYTNNRINIERLMQGQSYQGAQPIDHVSVGDAPALLIHGSGDHLVSPDQDALYGQALRDVGVPVEQLVVENAIHGLESIDGQPTTPTTDEVAARIQQFIIAHW